jgi:hypothetical protein
MTLLRAILVIFLLAACGGRTEGKAEIPDAGEEEPDPDPEPLGPATSVDVVFVVDNTLENGPAQRILAQTIPYFVDRLVFPRCVNGYGVIVDSPGAGKPCGVGVRDFAPVRDLRIAVVSSSLGGHGADSCSPASSTFNPEQNDRGLPLRRGPQGGTVPTYDGLGFLAWDPDAALEPPGEANQQAFTQRVRDLVAGAGLRGCGFNATLEAFHRFLVEPSPPASIDVENDVAVPKGTDQAVLDARAAFLRPDSLVLVVALTSRDDCSIRDGGRFYLAAQASLGGAPFHLPKPRSECLTNPDDPCCASCGQAPPTGCGPSANCDGLPLSPEEDRLALRCFDQKRRFGIDFLYPIERYVSALRDEEIADIRGEIHDNPLFVAGRRPSRVLFAAIAGVPWQDIARQLNEPAGGYVPATEMDWSRILGSDGEPPADPLMIPSLGPREGEHPLTGDALAPPDATSPADNPINGHEHALPDRPQYACIYPLPDPLSCTGGLCECLPGATDTNPICQALDGTYAAVQRYGAATPATRPLALVRDLGPQGILGSICAATTSATGAPGFGFKPSVDAIMRRLRHDLAPFDGP